MVTFPNTMVQGTFIRSTFYTDVWDIRVKFVTFFRSYIGSPKPIILNQFKSAINRYCLCLVTSCLPFLYCFTDLLEGPLNILIVYNLRTLQLCLPISYILLRSFPKGLISPFLLRCLKKNIDMMASWSEKIRNLKIC